MAKQEKCPTGIERAVVAAARRAASDAKFKGTSGQVWLARRLGVTQQAISQWVQRGWVPTNRADEIAQLTGVAARELMNPRLLRMVLDRVAA